jgi:hypothetical protein
MVAGHSHSTHIHFDEVLGVTHFQDGGASSDGYQCSLLTFSNGNIRFKTIDINGNITQDHLVLKV